MTSSSSSGLMQFFGTFQPLGYMISGGFILQPTRSRSTYEQPSPIGKVAEVRDANWSADINIVREAVKVRNDADDMSDICLQIPASNLVLYTLYDRMSLVETHLISKCFSVM
jgi:hypothetical protein